MTGEARASWIISLPVSHHHAFAGSKRVFTHAHVNGDQWHSHDPETVRDGEIGPHRVSVSMSTVPPEGENRAQNG